MVSMQSNIIISFFNLNTVLTVAPFLVIMMHPFPTFSAATCSRIISVAVIRPHKQPREGLIWFILLGHNPKDIKAGAQSGT